MKADLPEFHLSRREFIKVSSLGGIWLVTRNLTAFATEPAGQGNRSSGWSGSPGKARYRIEGRAKVLGQKIYARDFRARDMKGWPADEACAMVLRTAIAGRTLTGIDLSALPADLQPFKIVTAADLNRDGLVFPNSYRQADAPTPSLFASLGNAPQFLGQPVAILLFKNYWTYRRAHRLLQFNRSVLKFAEAQATGTGEAASSAESHHLVRPENPGEGPVYAPPIYFTRYADGTGERFSQVKNSFTNPYATTGARDSDREAAHWRQVIEADLQSAGWRIFHGEYRTQQLDPMFMEPESGLGWLESGKKTLHLLVGTQSGNGCVADTLKMFGAQGCAFQVDTIVLNACYPGGGFGGRDTSSFPTLLAIAAAYSPKPVRLAYDRFEQFQSGLKQLGASISQKLAIDSEGRFQAMVGKYELLAGGRNNYSQWIAGLAGYCGGGGYAIPRVSIDAQARASIGVIAGSMRGFGGPQAAFAVESLVDEAAIELKTDPIELRRRNALAKGSYTVTGLCIPHSLRIAEICERARRHPLWTEKDRVRQGYSGQGILYGVGFALANQPFGIGCDGVMASVDISPDGSISVTTNCVDMGNGSATSLAVSTAILGANATRIRLGEVTLFDALQITSRPYNGWSNPQYTPALSNSSSACITAFHQVHAVEQACRVLLENAIWPAARVLWNRPANEPFDATKVSWVNGALVMPGHQPLPLLKLGRALHDSGGIVGVMIHASYLGQWIEASFPLDNRDWKGAIDALAIRKAGGEHWTLINRTSVVQPPADAWNHGRSLHSPSGTLAAVLVDPQKAQVKVLAVHSYLEAGRVIQPDLLMGQYYGGVAMGVGYAFLEELPQTYGGPGEGDWNLNRYRVPRWDDLPLDQITLELLEPQPGEPPRGIAEAVLCPVPPALANAIAHATGKRFRSLPITSQKISEALH